MYIILSGEESQPKTLYSPIEFFVARRGSMSTASPRYRKANTEARRLMVPTGQQMVRPVHPVSAPWQVSAENENQEKLYSPIEFFAKRSMPSGFFSKVQKESGPPPKESRSGPAHPCRHRSAPSLFALHKKAEGLSSHTPSRGKIIHDRGRPGPDEPPPSVRKGTNNITYYYDNLLLPVPLHF